MKTRLTCDENMWVFRHNEYGDEPEWIGCANRTGTDVYFTLYGDNRDLSKEELQQLLDFLNALV